MKYLKLFEEFISEGSGVRLSVQQIEQLAKRKKVDLRDLEQMVKFISDNYEAITGEPYEDSTTMSMDDTIANLLGKYKVDGEEFGEVWGDLIGEGVMPSWARPHAPVGSIGHLAVENSFGEYEDPMQSMTRLSVGDKVRCIDPEKSSYGMVGQVVAFEDATVRWKVANTDDRVGVDALEYRCAPQCLQRIV